MKILHTADWHFREKDHDEIKKCLDFMLDYAHENVPDLFIVSGDITDSRYLNLDTRSARTIFNIINTMLSLAPVAVVVGTPSHDGSAALALRECRGKYQIVVSDRPEQFVYADGDWFPLKVFKGNNPDFLLTQIPQPTKQYFVNEMSIEDNEKAISNAMSSILIQFNVPPKYQMLKTPHILNGHFQVGGAFISETQQLIGRDIEISNDQIYMMGANLICLGHIHKAQNLGENIFYAGSPTRMNFGETEDKGFYLHDISGTSFHDFIQTPAKQMLEIKEDFTEDDSLNELDIVFHQYSPDELKNSDLKITITVWQDAAKQINQTEIKQSFIDAGCRTVKFLLIRKPREAVRAEKVLEADTLPDKLSAMAELRGEAIAESILEKAKSIEGGEQEPWKGII